MLKHFTLGIFMAFVGLYHPAYAQPANIARFDAIQAPNTLTVEDIQRQSGTDWFHEALIILDENNTRVAGIHIPLTGASRDFVNHKDRLAAQLSATFGMDVRIDCEAENCAVLALYKR